MAWQPFGDSNPVAFALNAYLGRVRIRVRVTARVRVRVRVRARVGARFGARVTVRGKGSVGVRGMVSCPSSPTAALSRASSCFLQPTSTSDFLLTTSYLLFTTHYSLLTTNYLLLITHYLLLTT